MRFCSRYALTDLVQIHAHRVGLLPCTAANLGCQLWSTCWQDCQMKVVTMWLLTRTDDGLVSNHPPDVKHNILVLLIPKPSLSLLS